MEDFMNRKQTEIIGIIGIRNFWTTDVVGCNNESKKGGKYQESIQSSTTPYKQEPRGQSFPSR